MWEVIIGIIIGIALLFFVVYLLCDSNEKIQQSTKRMSDMEQKMYLRLDEMLENGEIDQEFYDRFTDKTTYNRNLLQIVRD